jgi:hypothetical protein
LQLFLNQPVQNVHGKTSEVQEELGELLLLIALKTHHDFYE